MDNQETIDNDKLAEYFQEYLRQELILRGVPFTKVTAENFANVNIDVHIYIEDYWGRYLFKYIGIGGLKQKLSETTLENYVNKFVDRELNDLKESVEYTISEVSKMVKNSDGLNEEFLESHKKRLEDARKIASWLIKK